MTQVSETYYKYDSWSEDNLRYARPHFRMQKAARIVNRIAKNKECDLLDVGCGPAALMHLLERNIRYYGIDMAIHDPASNPLQMDCLEMPIRCGDKKFDIVVAQGVFEYIGKAQTAQLLNDGGKFIVSFVYSDHRQKQI